MPRLSLYKPEKGQDYTFMDRQISEMFQVGGTDVYLHKYLGPKLKTEGTADQPVYSALSETNIQDLLFLENRDRKYASEIYKIRGFYNVQNIDFNLSQFGLFIDNDTIYMTVHINDFIKYVGRKPLSGDVLELPHLRDEFALSDADISLPRYYVIEDVGRASEGFSATWYPHLYRLKLKKIFDSQQFADVLTKPTGADLDRFAGDWTSGTEYYTGQIVRLNGVLYEVNAGFEAPTGTVLTPPDTSAWSVYSGNTLESILSTRAKELQINDAIIQQAEYDTNTAVPYDPTDPYKRVEGKSGYETRQFYTLAVDEQGKTKINTADIDSLDASQVGYTTVESLKRPVRTGYTGYLVGDGTPSNGYTFGHGIQFPEQPAVDDFFLRTDFMPSRLFKFEGTRWIRVEDDVRMTMTNSDTRQTLKTSFINNNKYIYDQAVAVDYVSLEEGDTIIYTDIDYTSSLYVFLKLDTTEMSYAVADHPTIINNDSGKVRINLPIINTTQESIPYTGTWKLSLCNSREEQRQAVSKALRPKADL